MNHYYELLSEFGYCEGYVAIDEDDNYVTVSIDEECAELGTLQENGWMRVNIYYPDGTEDEVYRR